MRTHERALAVRGIGVGEFDAVPLDASADVAVVIEGGPLGISAGSSPIDGYVEDRLGLVARRSARLKISQRGRPGRDKI